MAKVNITPVKLEQNAFADVTLVAGNTEGFKIDFNEKDNKVCLIFQNGGSGNATVTVKKGNGIQGVEDLDTYTIAAGKFACINLESGAYKNVSGEDKGYAIVVPSSADVKCSEVVLP